ncbi:hypothetical protein GE061_004787 [Apolygus lucorum]|uniref:Uncharacterized protein n=1 Tax=Apolygus lucorum TaxID=248454 RepID=A0A8S9X1Z6_APOLU|nr:hypothetical protein GE061_004787 [Apolygus lucorum]
MKSKIKTKSDAKRTGNKKIKLAKWEQQFLELLQEEDNPTIALIPGACQAGFSGAGMDAAEGTDTLAGNNSKGTATCATISTSRYLQQTPAKPAKRTTSELRELETDETRKLSTGDLQSNFSSFSFPSFKNDIVGFLIRIFTFMNVDRVAVIWLIEIVRIAQIFSNIVQDESR